MIKPSAYAPATSAAIAKIVSGLYDPAYIAVVEGGREENSALLDEKFDYIFFTGSVAVGKVVMAAAARHLTPVTLELGGKSPVIVDETADIRLAARRIAFGKVLNAGQTCVEPDYLLIHQDVKARFVDAFGAALEEFFPGGDYSDMPVIISEKHYRRVKGLMEGEAVLLGGGTDDTRRWIAPTLLDNVAPDAPVMQEEIFGPVLPVITYERLDDAIAFVRARPKPLALYLFTASRAVERRVLNACAFGGGCVNDTIIHLATPHMPFGGVGDGQLPWEEELRDLQPLSQHRQEIHLAGSAHAVSSVRRAEFPNDPKIPEISGSAAAGGPGEPPAPRLQPDCYPVPSACRNASSSFPSAFFSMRDT